MAPFQGKKLKKCYLNISFKEAQKLVQHRYSCVEEIQHKMKIALSPKYLSNLRQGLKDQLHKLLFLYHEKLKGVPFAFDKIKIEDSSIIDDQEFFNLNIIVTFIVFKPQVSKICYGTITKITDHSFGCMFHRCINGSVRKPLQSQLSQEEKEIVCKMAVGKLIYLKINKIVSHNNILFVVGDIAQQHYDKSKTRVNSTPFTYNGREPSRNADDNNNINNADSNSEEICNVEFSTVKLKKKKRKREDEGTEKYIDHVDCAKEITQASKKKKKPKKSKDGAAEIGHESTDFSDLVKKKKINSKKKN